MGFPVTLSLSEVLQGELRFLSITEYIGLAVGGFVNLNFSMYFCVVFIHYIDF